MPKSQYGQFTPAQREEIARRIREDVDRQLDELADDVLADARRAAERARDFLLHKLQTEAAAQAAAMVTEIAGGIKRAPGITIGEEVLTNTAGAGEEARIAELKPRWEEDIRQQQRPRPLPTLPIQANRDP